MFYNRDRISKCIVCLLVFTSVFVLDLGGVYASREVDAEEFAFKFLEQVAGIDLDSVKVASFSASSSRIVVFEGDDRPRKSDFINVVFENGSNRFKASINLIDGRIWSYKLCLLSGNLGPDKLGFDDCLRVAYNAIEDYRMLSNASYCVEFAQLVLTVLKNESLTIDLNNPSPTNEEPSFFRGLILLARVDGEMGSLEIIYDKESSTVTFIWFEKIKGRWITIWRSINLRVSLKTGLVTSLGDSMMHYEVATTDVNVSEEEAIKIAMPYIQAYARKNLLLIKKIEATFSFETDSSLDRRQDRNGFYLIYPRWSVTATFDRVTPQNVFAYTVMIWADNGKVYHHGPQGYFSPDGGNNIYQLWPLSFVLATFIIIFTSLRIRKKHLAKAYHQKVREVS